VTNYNEDEEDEFEASENDMTPNYWSTAVEDTGPAIDRVLDYRASADTGMSFSASSRATMLIHDRA
jgi:chromodomain-helicase-DNA-binding protein 1